ncbi:phosphomannomutase [Bowdeniella nasicola]|uniref:Phosphomannomutase n=1 Tax=Bowdeniella nasicola TaxID=208480 RepID=A0A1Q5Q111_9ACTO|nr:phospho-sugar mutase [Bowdeniella nasicola]OKL53446.1 phosphomannomutase [Bowdeniella nasicola]
MTSLTFDDAAVRAWIDDDPDPTTAQELSDLLAAAEGGDEAASADLADRFSGTLQFGTAGLRGALGGGPNRMNRAVVMRAAAGLVAYLRNEIGDGFVVTIGYDARYGSKQFATDTAAIVTAAGGIAHLMPRTLPTPVLAFSVLDLDADAGVMVTASHNPPQDNGYKVYLGGRMVEATARGAQIVSPHDARIAEQIAKVERVADIERAEDGWHTIGEDLIDRYVARVSSMVPQGRAGSLKVVLTAMHGVGAETCMRALTDAGFTDVHLVKEQAEPDPDFPTVNFPNPEEPGALDLSFALAKKIGADLIIANDPDADRCSAAIPTRAGSWRQLSGDEVGQLLGEQAARLAAASGKGVLACSIVSSRMLGAIAASHGLTHAQTLTGFKWISRVPGLTFGYEEALGYCCDPNYVRDKDGISASVKLCLLASDLADRGLTLEDQLDQLSARHGVHATNPLTVRVKDLSLIADAMAKLRTGGLTELAGSPIVETVDLAEGSESLPPTDGMRFVTEANDRVIVRPSGTEPKLKCYLESVEPVPNQNLDLVPQAREAAARRVAQVKADLAAFLGV